MQTVFGFHGKNTVKNDKSLKDNEDYSEGIEEGKTKINRVKVSKVQDVSEIFRAA